MGIGIVNYGLAGNIYNIEKALKKAGAKVKVIDHKDDFSHCEKIVIPGVGSFKDAIRELEDKNLFNSIKNFNGKILGICLGMQILCEEGYEFGKSNGLGFFKAKVQVLEKRSILPHMGFKEVEILEGDNLFEGLNKNSQFYFMHSYEVLTNNHILASATYEKRTFIAALKKDNVYGVQFHPEKSREQGIKLFKNFINL